MQQEEGKELLKRYLDGSATPEDKALLEAWYEQFESKDQPEIPIAEKELQLGRVRQRLLDHSGQKQARIRKIKTWYQIAAAAVLLIFLTTGLYFYLNRAHELSPGLKGQQVAITPGKYQETLILANGQKIEITKSLRGIIARQGNTVIKAGNGESITYNAEGSETKTAYNTLSTARGEQSPYPLVLEDGTKVWLNAASSITFPTAFIGRDREVKITGEALFQVAHNSAKPFRVICKGQIVEDIGTQFDIYAYADEPVIKTTLLEGAVKVRGDNSTSVILKPGQQSVINGAEENSRVVISGSVNTEEIIAWKNEKFSFYNTDIRTVMRQLERWYNIDVEYTGNVANVTFSGGFSRKMAFSNVVKSLAFTGVNFKIKGRRVIVK